MPATDIDRHLTASQVEALCALVTGESNEAAAYLAGVSQRTLRRWRREPAFRAVLADARESLVEEAANRAVTSMTRGIDAMLAALENQEAPHLQLRAADLLLKWGTKFAAAARRADSSMAIERDLALQFNRPLLIDTVVWPDEQAAPASHEPHAASQSETDPAPETAAAEPGSDNATPAARTKTANRDAKHTASAPPEPAKAGFAMFNRELTRPAASRPPATRPPASRPSPKPPPPPHVQ